MKVKAGTQFHFDRRFNKLTEKGNYKRKQKIEKKPVWIVKVLGIACAISFLYIPVQEANRKVSNVEVVKAQEIPSVSTLTEKGFESADIPAGYKEPDLYDKYFGKDAKVMRAICKAENQAEDPLKVGDLRYTFWQDGQKYGMSVGLCQIRILPERGITVKEMQDPEHNIEYAKHLFDKSGFTPWTCYKNGSYKKYMD